MKRILFALVAVLSLMQIASAQSATVVIDAPAGTTLAEATPWTWTLFVNNTPFALTTTCGVVGPLITCQAPLPNISAALTPTGSQTFEAGYRSPIFGDSNRSVPFVPTRRGAPSTPRIQ